MANHFRNFVSAALMGATLIGMAIEGRTASYFVDYVGGSDANSGISTGSAWQHCPGDPSATGTPAATPLMPGDSVFFKGGTTYVLTAPYVSPMNAGIVLKWSGTVGNPITYDGNSSGNWGTGKAVLTDNYGTNCICAFYSGGATISNIAFVNFDIGPIGGTNSLPLDKGTLYSPNGIAPRPGSGISAGDTGAMINVVVSGCDFHDLGYYGSTFPLGNASLRGGAFGCAGCDGLTISNCTFARMRDGIYLNNPKHIANFTFTGCTITQIEEWGLTLITHTNAYLSNVFICNNLFTNCDQNYASWGGYGPPPHRDTIFSFGDEGCGGSCSVTRGVVDANVNIYNNYFVDTLNQPGGSVTVWFIDGASVNVYNNVFNNCQSGDAIVSFGGPATNTVVHAAAYNNTFYIRDYQLPIVTGGVPITGIKWPIASSNHSNFFAVENNIMFMFSIGTPYYSGYCYNIVNTADGGKSGFTNNCIFDYNCYNSINSYLGKMVYGYYQELLGYITTNTAPKAGWDLHSLTGNPLFLNPSQGDFHLITNSPAIGRGLNLSSLNLPGLNMDRDGNPRPSTGAWTMGAYQNAVARPLPPTGLHVLSAN